MKIDAKQSVEKKQISPVNAVDNAYRIELYELQLLYRATKEKRFYFFLIGQDEIASSDLLFSFKKPYRSCSGI